MIARPVLPVAATGTRPARVLNGLVLVSPAAAELREVTADAARLDEEVAGDVEATATM